MRVKLEPDTAFIGKKFAYIFLGIIFGFDAINITIGLPFVRITPDHGPNYEMFGLNKSKPDSLVQAFSFLNTHVAKA